MTRLIFLLITIAATGCAAAAPKATLPAGVDAEKAATLLAQADPARKGGNFDEARELLLAASEAAAAHQRHDVATATDDLNRAQSRSVSDDIATQIEDGLCADALAYTATYTSKSEMLASAIRDRSDKQLTGCIEKHIDKGDIAGAYKMASGEDAEKGLSAHTLKAVRKMVRKAMAGHVTETISPAFKQHDYTQVMTQLAQLVEKGEATAKMQSKVVASVRVAIQEDIDSIYGNATAQTTPAATALKQVDALIAVGWPKDGKDEAPKALNEKRQHLRFLIGCETIDCKSADVTERWTYGDAGLFRLDSPQSNEPTETLRSGTRLWQLAKGKERSLVATIDPGAPADLIARAMKAAGWIDTKMLRAQDTSEWLPPGDSLLKTRVWAPLRKGEKLYELGYVTALDGPSVTVRRLSDRKEVVLQRIQVHFGILKAETKVMAYCRTIDKLEPALIASVKETHFEQQGDPLVTLRCLGDDGKVTGQNKEAQLTSVRMNRGWLPIRR